MTVRIETTGVTRGMEFALYAHGDTAPAVSIYAYNPTLNTYEVLAYEYEHIGILHAFKAIAPSMDGFLMAKIGDQKLIKRIGNPITHFMFSYKIGFTLAYEAININGGIEYSGNLNHITDGFYSAPITDDVIMIRVTTIRKSFLINKNILKMNYEVTMDIGALNSSFDDVSLSEVSLQSISLNDVTLNSTLPNTTITEL